MDDPEQAVLSIFREFDVKSGEMLLWPSFLGKADKYGITEKQLQDGLASLIQMGLVELKEQKPPGAYFLSEKGYQKSLKHFL